MTTTILEDLMATPKLTIDHNPSTDKFEIHGWTQAHRMGLLSIPGCSFAGKGKNFWTIPARYAQIVALGNTYQLDWTQAAADRYTSIYEVVSVCQDLRTVGLSPENEAHMVEHLKPWGFSPKPGQAAAMVHLATAERAALFSVMGSGKSAVVVGTMRLYGIAPVLVVCPKGLLYNWQRELNAFGIDSVILQGTPLQRSKIEANFDPSKTPVMICSYGVAKSSTKIAGYGNTALKRCNGCGGGQDIPEQKCEVHERFLNTIDWSAIVVDEAHRLRDPHTPQTRSIWHLTSQVKYAWLLTGTPIESSPDEFWSLLHALDPLEYPSSVKHRDRYLLQNVVPWSKVPEIIGLHPRTAAEFKEVTEWRWRRDLKVGTPETVYEVRTCELGARNAKAYKQMKEQMAAELASGVYSAQNSMVQHGKLRQFANARCDVSDVTGEVTMHDPSEKLDLWEETLGDFNESIISWFASVKLLKLASERLTAKGVEHVVIHGEISAADRQRAVDRFQAGEVDLILLNPATGGEGITLTRARVSIRVMRSDSSIHEKQAKDRNDRYGVVHEELLVIDLVTLGTIEEELGERFDEKQDRFTEVIS